MSHQDLVMCYYPACRQRQRHCLNGILPACCRRLRSRPCCQRSACPWRGLALQWRLPAQQCGPVYVRRQLIARARLAQHLTARQRWAAASGASCHQMFVVFARASGRSDERCCALWYTIGLLQKPQIKMIYSLNRTLHKQGACFSHAGGWVVIGLLRVPLGSILCRTWPGRESNCCSSSSSWRDRWTSYLLIKGGMSQYSTYPCLAGSAAAARCHTVSAKLQVESARWLTLLHACACKCSGKLQGVGECRSG